MTTLTPHDYDRLLFATEQKHAQEVRKLKATIREQKRTIRELRESLHLSEDMLEMLLTLDDGLAKVQARLGQPMPAAEPQTVPPDDAA